jgi:hypothetical protein
LSLMFSVPQIRREPNIKLLSPLKPRITKHKYPRTDCPMMGGLATSSGAIGEWYRATVPSRPPFRQGNGSPRQWVPKAMGRQGNGRHKPRIAAEDLRGDGAARSAREAPRCRLRRIARRRGFPFESQTSDFAPRSATARRSETTGRFDLAREQPSRVPVPRSERIRPASNRDAIKLYSSIRHQRQPARFIVPHRATP